METAKETTNQIQPEETSERDSLPKDLYIEQYSSLRSEIEKRLDIRQATLTFTLVLAGTFLSVAAQPGIAAATAFYYPIVALFLAAAWTHNDSKIGQISQYIKLEVEQRMAPFTGWEVYRKTTFDGTHPLTLKSGLVSFSTRGTFLATEALALLVGSIRSIVALLANPQPGMIVITVALFVSGVGATIWSYFLLQHRRS
jgi:hypothetical protein